MPWYLGLLMKIAAPTYFQRIVIHQGMLEWDEEQNEEIQKLNDGVSELQQELENTFIALDITEKEIQELRRLNSG